MVVAPCAQAAKIHFTFVKQKEYANAANINPCISFI